jgi:hypothetical protein
MSLVDEVRSFRQRVAQRLDELEPLVREYNELKQIAAEIGLDDEGPGEPAAAASDRPAEAPDSPAEAGGASVEAATRPAEAVAESIGKPRGRPRARRSNTTRRTEAADLRHRVVDAVRADPGKTVADYAVVLGVAPTALYRPVRELTTEGALVKRARQLFAG